MRWVAILLGIAMMIVGMGQAGVLSGSLCAEEPMGLFVGLSVGGFSITLISALLPDESFENRPIAKWLLLFLGVALMICGIGQARAIINLLQPANPEGMCIMMFLFGFWMMFGSLFL